MNEGPQHTRERESRSLRRAGRGMMSGLVIGGLVGAVAGLVIGAIAFGWGAGGMWGGVLTGLIGGLGVGWFIGGVASLDDAPRGDEPRPDPRLRGDMDA